jgi:hypothetical protein
MRLNSKKLYWLNKENIMRNLILTLLLFAVFGFGADPQLSNLNVIDTSFEIIEVIGIDYIAYQYKDSIVEFTDSVYENTDSTVVFDSAISIVGCAWVKYSPATSDSFILCNGDTVIGRWQIADSTVVYTDSTISYTDSVPTDSSTTIKWKGSITFAAMDPDADTMGVWIYIIIEQDTVLIDSLWGDYTMFSGANKTLNFKFTYPHKNWTGSCNAKVKLIADDLNTLYPVSVKAISTPRVVDTGSAFTLSAEVVYLYGAVTYDGWDVGLQGSFTDAGKGTLHVQAPNIENLRYMSAVKVITDSNDVYYDTVRTVVVNDSKYYYEIGDTGPAGGIVFHDKGSFSDGWRYLECAPHNQGTGGSTWNSAIIICENLDLNGYTDWFLPSINDLSLMYQNLHRKGLGGFSYTYYWSSTAYSTQYAWYFDFF